MDHRDKPGDDEVIEINKIHPSAHKVAKTSVSWTIFSVKMRGYLSVRPVRVPSPLPNKTLVYGRDLCRHEPWLRTHAA